MNTTAKKEQQEVQDAHPLRVGYAATCPEESTALPCVREENDEAISFGYASFSERVEEKAMRKLEKLGIDVLPPTTLTDFLLKIGYSDLNKDALATVEALVCMNLLDDSFWIEREYNSFAEMQGCTLDAVRTKLTYHLKRHYDEARQTIQALCGITPSAHYEGNKLFIITLGHAYTVYCSRQGCSLF